MDDIEQRLKRDAGRIQAEVTPELASRIGAALAAEAPRRAPARNTKTPRLWLAAGLSGAAAALLVFAVLPRESERTAIVEAPAAYSVPEYAHSVDRPFPLDVEEAEFTAPLEEELENLQADLEKARRSVAEDIAF